MSVVYKKGSSKFVYIKGEPKGLFEISSKIIKNEQVTDLGILERERKWKNKIRYLDGNACRG